MKRLAETELLCIHIVFDSSALVPCFPKRSRYFTNARTTGVCFPPACRAFWRSTGYIAKPTLFSPPSLLGTGSRSTRTQEDRRNYLSAADKASDHSFRAHGNVSVVELLCPICGALVDSHRGAVARAERVNPPGWQSSVSRTSGCVSFRRGTGRMRTFREEKGIPSISSPLLCYTYQRRGAPRYTPSALPTTFDLLDVARLVPLPRPPSVRAPPC